MRYSLPLTLVLVAACSHQPKVSKAPVSTPTPKVTSVTEGPHYTSLVFEKGKTVLSKMSKQHLNELAARANREGREIDNIKILAWADREYPDKVESKAPTREVILAKKRAESIKEYLQEDLHAEEKIDSFNMAKRPGLVSKMVRGEEYQLKEEIEHAGASASRLDNGNVSYSKASKALVIIDYQDDK